MSGPIELKAGQTIGSLAQQYHTSVAAILEANPDLKGKDLTKLQVGTHINIPIAGKNDAPTDTAAIKKTPEQKKGEEVANLIKEYGYGENYKVSVDKDGNYHITLKKDTSLAEIKDQLGLGNGVLRNSNPDLVENAKKPLLSVHSDPDLYNDDNRVAGKGVAFTLPANTVNPKDPDDTFGNKLAQGLSNAWDAFKNSF